VLQIKSYKNKKASDSEIIAVSGKRTYSSRQLLAAIYDLLEYIPFIRRIIRLFTKRYELIYPEDTKEASYLAMKQILKICAISILSLCVIFGLNPGYFTFLSSILIIYIISVENISREGSKIEIRFLKELDSFLANTKHYYYQKNQITEAFADAAGISDKIMRGHAEMMIRCINSGNREQALVNYMNSGYHKYLKLLLSLAVLVEENGDIRDSEGSVFLNSLMQLRNDVLADINYIREKRHKFSGLGYTAGLPVLAVPYIAIWGAETIPSLKSFYFGYTGMLIKGGLLCITYVCYTMIVRLREGDRLDRRRYPIAERLSKKFPFSWILDVIIKRNYGKSMRLSEDLRRFGAKYTAKSFYMLRLIYLLAGLCISIVVCEMGHSESRDLIIRDTADISNLSAYADGRQISAMERLIPEYTVFYIENNSEPDVLLLEQSLLDEKGIRSKEIAKVSAKEILRRTEVYKLENFGLADFILSLLIAFLCYIYPAMMMSFKRILSENKMQDEVMQFQSLIHMLKKVPGISAADVLVKMEDFAEIFRPSIQQCINEYNISDTDALERLYAKEKYAGFRKIIDCFMMVDEMGVEDAFEEISSEITAFKENRKLERSILLENEGLLGALIAIMPGGLIIFGYLLCPFLIKSVQIFSSYQAQLQQLSD